MPLQNEPPKLIIVRGHPGSGKTTYARALLEENPQARHFENDQFFTKDGVYAFDIARHAEAKAWCLKSVADSLAAGFDTVVSSTFTTHAEMAPYLALSEKPEVVEMFLEYPDTHQVPPEVVRAKKEAFEPYAGALQVFAPQRPLTYFKPEITAVASDENNQHYNDGKVYGAIQSIVHEGRRLLRIDEWSSEDPGKGYADRALRWLRAQHDVITVNGIGEIDDDGPDITVLYWERQREKGLVDILLLDDGAELAPPTPRSRAKVSP